MRVAVLGCAAEYRAVVHWRGGSRPFISPSVDAVTSVSWSRTLNDVSEASITIVGSAAADCCGQLGQITGWAHELSLYRDAELVWQGPIAQAVRWNRSGVVIEARDVLSWLERCKNTDLLRYVNLEDNPDAEGRRRGPVQWIAAHIIRRNLTSPFSQPPDYPGLLDYIVRDDSRETTRFEKDGGDNRAIWNVPVLEVLGELTKRGLAYTAVGRSILLRAPKDGSDRAQARLTLDHVVGDVEVIQDCSAAATYAWATSQRSDNISEGATAGTGEVGTPYGRLDWIVESSTDAEEEELRQMAREALRGRYPTPLVVSIPDGSRLAPNAPLTIQQLVPGERVDVTTAGLCVDVTAAFLISDVEVSWGTSGEEVAVTLVPAVAPPEGGTT